MYYNNSDVRVEEMPTPQIGKDELLLKSLACGICGSDVMEWYRIHKAPLVLGHEATGEIVETGEDVKRFKKGDRVFVSHHVPCNTCHYCLNGNHTVCDTLRSTNFDPGGFAEYIRIPQINVDRGVFVLPDNVSLEDGSTMDVKVDLVDTSIQHLDWSRTGDRLVFAGRRGGGLEFWTIEDFLP